MFGSGKKFNPEKDIPNLSGKIYLVTGYAFVSTNMHQLPKETTNASEEVQQA
jgi:hypothetical protein